jgi:hypothetical protein
MNNPTCTEVKKPTLAEAMLEIARAAEALYPNMVGGRPKFLRVVDDEVVKMTCSGPGALSPLNLHVKFRVAFDALVVETKIDHQHPFTLSMEDVEFLGRVQQFLAVAVRHNGLEIA